MNPYEKYNLRDNPFQFLTPSFDNGGELTWADMKKVKSEIEHTYSRIINKTTRQVVLNWGPYGGGKTFAAYYFIENIKHEKSIEHIYLRIPKIAKTSTNELFVNVIDFLSFNRIKQKISSLVKDIGEESFISFVSKKIRNEEFAEAILLLSNDDKDIQQLMHRYIYEGLTKTELKKVGLPRNISTNTDTIKFLAGVLSCFIGERGKGKVVIWLDEMEDLVYYSKRDYTLFSQLLRDLIDSLNQHFAIFLNFTLAEPEESTIELLLGGALWSRINKKIRFQHLSKEDAYQYFYDLLNAYRIRKENNILPFDEDATNVVLDNIPKNAVTPREINRYFSEIIETALEKDITSINKEFVIECLDSLKEE
jgi:hypothetical protein